MMIVLVRGRAAQGRTSREIYLRVTGYMFLRRLQSTFQQIATWEVGAAKLH